MTSPPPSGWTFTLYLAFMIHVLFYFLLLCFPPMPNIFFVILVLLVSCLGQQQQYCSCVAILIFIKYIMYHINSFICDEENPLEMAPVIYLFLELVTRIFIHPLLHDTFVAVTTIIGHECTFRVAFECLLG